MAYPFGERQLPSEDQEFVVVDVYDTLVRTTIACAVKRLKRGNPRKPDARTGLTPEAMHFTVPEPMSRKTIDEIIEGLEDEAWGGHDG